jgi:hypothetical protein
VAGTGRDHYLQLPGAIVVATEGLMRLHENLADVVAERAMMCVHGDAGLVVAQEPQQVQELPPTVAAAAEDVVQLVDHQHPDAGRRSSRSTSCSKVGQTEPCRAQRRASEANSAV